MNFETEFVVTSHIRNESINVMLIKPEANVSLESNTMDWAALFLQAFKVIIDLVSFCFVSTIG